MPKSNAGRKPKPVATTVDVYAVVEDLAGRGLTIQEIAEIIGETQYQVNRGQFSKAYTRGRANAKSAVLAAQKRRALDDKHFGCVQAAKHYLGVVHHMSEHSTVSLAHVELEALIRTHVKATE